MKHSVPKRLLSLLLCLCLLLALFAGLTVVSAVGENAIRNWGTRDTVCTQLSTAAQNYYSGSNSYATLKTLSGASDTSNSLTAAQSNNLFNALHTLMESTHTTVSDISYSSHSSWYAYTDCENGDTSGKMKLIWAGGYRTWDGSYVNREHVWCKSHATYVETNGGADLHHLRPASAIVNQQSHNNKPYGSAQANGGTACQDEEGNAGGWYLNATTNFSDGLYEPPDNAKGDCARILLYVYTRWKQPNLYTSLDTSSSGYTSFVEETPSGTCDGVATIESLETLLQWCEEDPVDTWEMGRNDAVQSIQGNRNVFIDYPELAWYMFGLTPPSDMTTPSGDAASGGTSYSVTNVTVNNSAYGTAVITNSNTVTVTPAAGCYLASATATTGTVAINGNVITVSGMTADTTVNVVLAQNATYTVSFSVPSGVTQTSMSGYANSTITLPTPNGVPTANAQSYEFFGWTTGTVSDTTTQPTYYAAGSSYTITGNTTLTALYRYVTSTGSGSTAFSTSGNGGTYVLAANVDGTYYALPTSGLGTARPSGSQITVTNGAVSAANASGYEWTLTKSGSAFNISSGSTYLTWSSSTALSSSSDPYAWTIEANDTTTWKLIPSGDANRSLIFRAGSYYVFGGYVASNLGGDYKAIEILPIGSSSSNQTYYTTELQSSCTHSFGSAVAAGAEGHTYTCTLCGYTFTEPHNYASVTSGLTTTYTCSVCGYSYQTTLGTYTVSYNVCGSTGSTDTVTEGSSVTLPTAPAYTGYTFCGWATDAAVTETETAPTVLTGSYTPTQDITLYAVYSRVVAGGGSGTTSYVLVTDTDQLVAGRNLIIAAKDYDYAMAGIYSSYYRNQASVTKSGSTLTPSSGVYLFTLGAGSAADTWSLYDTTNSAYLTAYQSGSYYDLGTEASVSANSSFSVSVDGDGTASLTTNSGTCVVKYFKSTSYEEYKCVSASTTTNIYDITLYVETPGSTDATYYTTQPTVLCAHSSTTLVGAAAATCTAAGYTGDTVCDDCGQTVTQGAVIPALGHNYSSSVTTPATCGAAGVLTYTCSRCGDTYTEPIAATGEHTYNSGVQTTAPSCTQAGVLTYTCTVCGSTSTEPIAALGHNYGSFASDNDGTHSQTCSRCGSTVTEACSYTSTVTGNLCTYTCTVCGYAYTETLSTWTITLTDCGTPTAYSCVDGNDFTFPSCDGVTVDGTEYTFVGWVASTVEETTTAPSVIHLAGETYTPGKSMTYYALYSSTTEGEPKEEYRLVTATSQLAAGDSIVIAARSSAYAISVSGSTVSRTSVSKSSSNTVLTINSATVFTLEAGSVNGTWSFKSGSSYLSLPNKNSTSSMTTAASKGYPTSWTLGSIDANNGGAVLSAKKSATEQVRYMRYSTSAFSLTNNSANTVVLYKKYTVQTDVTAYTTELDLHTHQYTAAVTTPATCLTAGVMTYTCTCGDTYTEAIAALGHNYGAWTSDSNGTHSKSCARCSDTVTESCTYSSAKVNGYTVYTCTVCAYSYSVCEHDSVYLTGSFAAACTMAGYSGDWLCATCGETVEAGETVPALGHDYVSHAAQAPTCTAVGWNAYQTCTRCDYTTYTELAATGHALVTDAAVAATCTASGLTAGEHCTRCDYAVAQETVPALGHDYVSHAAQAPTCTAVGWNAYQTCTRCDYTTYTELAATGHALVTDAAVAATCTASGLTAGEHCTRCDYAVAQETVPALGHDYVNHAAQTPTCTAVGWNAYQTCTRCDYTTYTEIPALGTLQITSAALRLDEDIDVLYTVAAAEGYTDLYMVFTMHGVSHTVTEYTDNGDGTYCFVFTGVTPQCMGDNIAATLYASKNGQNCTDTVAAYSVRQYCVNQLERYPEDTALVTLLSDLLTYGAAAQNYTAYETDNLVTDGLTLSPSTYSALSGKTVLLTGTQSTAVDWTAATLVLRNDLAVRFTFAAESTDGLTVTVSLNGRQQTFDASDFVAAGDGRYCVEFAGIKATEFDDAVTASFAVNGEAVGRTAGYTVNTYVCGMQNVSDAALQTLVRALYNYGASAAAIAAE